jgi:hypothetical protein
LQLSCHDNDKLPVDRKRSLNEIRFAWKDEGVHSNTHSDKICHQKHAQLETEPGAQGHRKRPCTCLAEGGRMAASTNKKDKAAGSCGSVEERVDGHEKDANRLL